MLNQTQRLYKSKSKSKIFITILCIFGLLFSWSCSCKNRVSNPDNTPPQHIDPDTFAIKAATDNVVTSLVKSSTTSISDIKIAFTEANNHDYTMDYTVEDAETDEAKKLTKEDFQLANKVLTAKDSVATKVKLVDSSAGPVEKTITINFTFKANDASLKNNTQTLSVDVTLTHAQKVDDSNIDNAITKILNGISGNAKTLIQRGPAVDLKQATFIYNKGTYATGVYTLKNEETSNPIEQFDADNEQNFSGIKEVLDYYLPQIAAIKSASKSTKEAEGGVGQSYYKVYYDITWDDKYEFSLSEIAFQFDLK